ncbi:MAG: acyl-CoA thioesterase [Prevotellaceae bacterium]|jgi:acyl-CoA thioester hydrolase|nr:acyl-CoA thioesterase [Prevotellaceae bacterium]
MHKVPIQIRFSDIDGVGHVNNAVYSDYFDVGRLQYFREAFGRPLNWGDAQTLVLVHTEADYLQPTFLYDRIEVHTSVVEISRRSVKMQQRIVAAGGSVRVKGYSVLSTCDRDTGQSFPMPEEWRKKIAAFENLMRKKGEEGEECPSGGEGEEVKN